MRAEFGKAHNFSAFSTRPVRSHHKTSYLCNHLITCGGPPNGLAEWSGIELYAHILTYTLLSEVPGDTQGSAPFFTNTIPSRPDLGRRKEKQSLEVWTLGMISLG